MKEKATEETIALNKVVGIRLRAVRSIYNEGLRFTLEQFAHILNISWEKLNNYETGRSTLPMITLYDLYQRGINPMFLLLGKGDIFSDSEEGKYKRARFEQRGINYKELIKELLKNNSSATHFIRPSVAKIKSGIKVAAGKIPTTDQE